MVNDSANGACTLVAAKILVAMRVTNQQQNIPRPNPYWTSIETSKDVVPGDAHTDLANKYSRTHSPVEEPIHLKIIKF